MSLHLESLSFAYGVHPVLERIDLHLDVCVTALIGPNAVGKTTLMRCVAGTLPGGGRVLLDGVDLCSLSRRERRRRIGYLAQDTSGDAQLTVLEAVLLGRFQSLSWRVDDNDVDLAFASLRQVGAAGLALRPLSELSGGQRQLVAIAQVLVKQPRVLLLDEPINNLDLKHQLEVLALMDRLARDRDVIVLLALHDVNLAARYAQKVVVLAEGRVYASGAPASVLTALMLRDVYDVNARVHLDADGVPVISVLNAISMAPNAIGASQNGREPAKVVPENRSMAEGPCRHS